MNNEYLFTSESVSPGHPDKLSDQLSDAVLDYVFESDKNARVACEVLTKGHKESAGSIVVAGEITCTHPLDFDQTTDCVGQVERMEHVEELLPEICSLDCGSFNYPIDNYVYISSTNMLRIGAERLQKIGVKPELETFDLGHIWFAKQMIEEGLIDSPPLFQICLNVRWAAEALPRNFQTMLDNLPDGANWSAFALGALEMPMVAQSAMLGGHARVGLEDNLYLDRGVLATNAQLVERARNILELIGCKVQSPQEARDSFNLKRFH